MKIIPLINEITNTFNETFSKNLNPLNLENKIRNFNEKENILKNFRINKPNMNMNLFSNNKFSKDNK